MIKRKMAALAAGMTFGATAAIGAHAQQLTDLYAEIGRLTHELTWLKKRLP